MSPRSDNGHDRRPRIALTMGDPAGVGPEVVLKAAAVRKLRERCDLVAVTAPGVYEQWSELLGIRLEIETLEVGAAVGKLTPGTPTSEGAAAALEVISATTEMCLTGEFDAMVTAPVSKAAITATGAEFPGHTEFLARASGTGKYLMMFVADSRRVALVTTHLPLSDVPRAITYERVLEKLVILDAGLELWFGVKSPRIAVTGLNPHAGEGGIFGDEEARAIVPAIQTARDRGIAVEGPFAADTIFTGLGGAEGPGSDFDAVLAMYHDQGTIPIKIFGFSDGVNVTLGLPIVRTSVDHGTAFDLAGRGEADPGSMISAVTLARDIAHRLRRLENAERESNGQ